MSVKRITITFIIYCLGKFGFVTLCYYFDTHTNEFRTGFVLYEFSYREQRLITFTLNSVLLFTMDADRKCVELTTPAGVIIFLRVGGFEILINFQVSLWLLTYYDISILIIVLHLYHICGNMIQQYKHCFYGSTYYVCVVGVQVSGILSWLRQINSNIICLHIIYKIMNNFTYRNDF